MKHKGSTKRFGARYGLKVRKRLEKVEILTKSTKICPYCGHAAVKKLAIGIFICKKCGRKFTGKAYTVSKDVPEVTQEKEE